MKLRIGGIMFVAVATFRLSVDARATTRQPTLTPASMACRSYSAAGGRSTRKSDRPADLGVDHSSSAREERRGPAVRARVTRAREARGREVRSAWAGHRVQAAPHRRAVRPGREERLVSVAAARAARRARAGATDAGGDHGRRRRRCRGCTRHRRAGVADAGAGGTGGAGVADAGAGGSGGADGATSAD